MLTIHEFSPSPWKAGDSYTGQIVTDANGKYVASVIASEGQCVSTAIAKTPELIDALQSCLDWLIEGEHESGTPLGSGEMGYKFKVQKPVIIAKIKSALEM